MVTIGYILLGMCIAALIYVTFIYISTKELNKKSKVLERLKACDTIEELNKIRTELYKIKGNEELLDLCDSCERLIKSKDELFVAQTIYNALKNN